MIQKLVQEMRHYYNNVKRVTLALGPHDKQRQQRSC